MARDLFIGTWQLDPAQNKYEMGQAPQAGTYVIEARGKDYRITMEWTNAAGEDNSLYYDSMPDGKDHAYDGVAGVDAIVTTRVDDRTLDTESKKDGQVVARGRRVLSADGRTMTVTQSGSTPDGNKFVNLSVYKRQG